jgi:3-oxoacyl-(acyl-carrier-protein) synthase
VSRVVITGLGCLSPAGCGVDPLVEALASRSMLGAAREVPVPLRRSGNLRVAKIPSFDREALLPARKLRRMGEASQLWTLACREAHLHAGLEQPAAEARTAPPEMRGTFLGTGFGCTDTTWDYLEGVFRDGMATASPFLFAESVANSPAGHSAIELDARGTCVTLTCGDASAAAATIAGERALRDGRLELAYCGGLELMSTPLLNALASLAGPSLLGEGAACLVLETLRSARTRGARIFAELAGSGMASDPRASATSWTARPEPIREAMRRALDAAAKLDPEGPACIGKVMLHACGRAESDAAERRAADAVCPGVLQDSVSPILGSHAAAGGLALLAAALEVERSGSVLLSAHAWGGSAYALVLRSLAA